MLRSFYSWLLAATFLVQVLGCRGTAADRAWKLEREFRETGRKKCLEELEKLGPDGEEALKRILAYDTLWQLGHSEGRASWVDVIELGIEPKRRRWDDLLIWDHVSNYCTVGYTITNSAVVEWAQKHWNRYKALQGGPGALLSDP